MVEWMNKQIHFFVFHHYYRQCSSKQRKVVKYVLQLREAEAQLITSSSQWLGDEGLGHSNMRAVN